MFAAKLCLAQAGCSHCLGCIFYFFLGSPLLQNRRAASANLPIKARQRPRFVITGRGWNTSELTSPPERLHNTKLPFQQSLHHPATLPLASLLPPASLSFIRSEISDFFFLAAQHLHLIVSASSHRNDVHFRRLLSLCGLRFASLEKRVAHTASVTLINQPGWPYMHEG